MIENQDFGVPYKKYFIVGAIVGTIGLIGTILAIVGALDYFTTYVEPPYFWMLTLCKAKNTLNQTTYITKNLKINETCPENLLATDFEEEDFFVDSSIISSEGIPWKPSLYVTHGVIGDLLLQVNVVDVIEASTSFTIQPFNTEVQTYDEFAIFGSEKIQIFKNGPLNGEGDYLTKDCNNLKTGCEYAPSRSLSSYNITDFHIKVSENVVENGSILKIKNIELSVNSGNHQFLPDVLLKFSKDGQSDKQEPGFILLIVGLFFADVSPAIIYFYVQRTNDRRNYALQIEMDKNLD